MKPDWEDAPEWANYLAMDKDNGWHWFENEPIPDVAGWWWTSGKNQYHYDPTLEKNWKDSLEKRPDAD